MVKNSPPPARPERKDEINPLNDLKAKLDALKAATGNMSLQREMKKIDKLIEKIEKEIKYYNGLGAGSTGQSIGEKMKQRLFVKEHLATRPNLTTAIDKLIEKAEQQLGNKENNEKAKAVAALKASRNEAVPPAKPAPTQHEILHEQPKFSRSEIMEREKMRRENESARMNTMMSKLATAAAASQAHRERLLQDIEKRNSRMDEPVNQRVTDISNEIKTRDATAKAANDAFIKQVQARGVNETGNSPALTQGEKIEAQERMMNSISTVIEQQNKLMALVQPDNYKGTTHSDLRKDIKELINSIDFKSKLPTEQQNILLKALHNQQETVAARKGVINKFIEGDYSKWLDTTIKALESHKVVYDTAALTSFGTKITTAPPAATPTSPSASTVSTATTTNKTASEEMLPPPSISTPSMKR